MPSRSAPTRRPASRVHGSVGVQSRRAVLVLDSDDESLWGISEDSVVVTRETAELPLGTRNLFAVAVARVFQDLGPARARRLLLRLARSLLARAGESSHPTAPVNDVP